MLVAETEKRAIHLLKYEWNHYKTLLIVFIAILTLELYLSGYLQIFLESMGKYGYLGGFVAGFLYTFGITTPFAVAATFILAEILNIWILTFLSSLGGVLSELIIYVFAREESGKSIKISKNRKIKIPEIKSKLLIKLSPLIAGIIIATPIPDEFASILFGIEKYKLRNFLIFTFVCKFIGTLLIVALGKIF